MGGILKKVLSDYIFGLVVSAIFEPEVSIFIAAVSGAEGVTVTVESEEVLVSVFALSLQAVIAKATIIIANNFFIANFFNGLLMSSKIYLNVNIQKITTISCEKICAPGRR